MIINLPNGLTLLRLVLTPVIVLLLLREDFTLAFLVFLVSWDEFAYGLLLQVTHRPLPPLLYYLAAFGHPGLASAVAVIMAR